MTTRIILVMICHHMIYIPRCYQAFIDYIPHFVHFIPMTHYFATGSSKLFQLFLFPPHPCLHWQPPICSLYLRLCFCLLVFDHLFCCLDSTYKWNHTAMTLLFWYLFSFSHEVGSDILHLHGLEHTRLLCPPLSPRVCSDSCPLSQWCYLTISSCHPLLFLPSVFPSIRVFSSESALRIRWPKYWSFNFDISPSNEYSGLISFRIEWFDLLAVQGTPRVFFTPQFESIDSSALSFLCSPTLTSIHDYWKNHSLD